MGTDLGMRRARGASRDGRQSGGRGLLGRVGVASVAAGSAGLTIVIGLCAWMLHGGEPADAESRAAGLSTFGSSHPQLHNYGSAALPADAPHSPALRLASLGTTFADRFAPTGVENGSDSPETTASTPSFSDRFSYRQSAPPTRSLGPSQPPVAFADRFAGAIASGVAPAQFAMIDPRTTAAAVAPAVTPAPAPAPAHAAAPAPHAAVRALVARVETKRPAAAAPTGSYRLASLGDTPIRTAYASTDSATKNAAIDDSLLKKMTPRDAAPKDTATKDAAPKDGAKDSGPLAGIDTSRTAIYDIAAHMVYLPNGHRLEAHSGLAEHMDDMRSVTLRSLGPTPPGIYDLTMREARFHGVDAIRLNPVDITKMYGRAGILAHPYMLGPNGQSNGCVSFKDYPEFLAAFRRGEFNRLVVVERLDDAPGGGQTASGWIADKLKGIFGRS
jgi:hypothetical protein